MFARIESVIQHPDKVVQIDVWCDSRGGFQEKATKFQVGPEVAIDWNEFRKAIEKRAAQENQAVDWDEMKKTWEQHLGNASIESQPAPD
jgi:hypothetical protein